MDFYNEIDPYAADWLENLILAGHLPEGKVDRRSIRDIRPEELEAWSRAHFFAGIGGWPLALRLAGWPATKPVWTGSCPCQPYSAAGKQEGNLDERDLWPDFFRLIREQRPPTVFGEQVANSVGFGWIDRVQTDLAAEGYTVRFVVLGAHSVGAPHIRQRLYWVAYSEHEQHERQLRRSGEEHGANSGRAASEPAGCSAISGLGESINERLERHAGNGNGRSQSRRIDTESTGSASAASGDGDWMEHADKPGGVRSTEGRSIEETDGGKHNAGFWDRYDLVPCSDGKARKFEPGIFPLVNGVSGGVAIGSAIQEAAASFSDEEKAHVVSRVGVLKGAGNAIVPQVAAEFIKAFMEIRND